MITEEGCFGMKKETFGGAFCSSAKSNGRQAIGCAGHLSMTARATITLTVLVHRGGGNRARKIERTLCVYVCVCYHDSDQLPPFSKKAATNPDSKEDNGSIMTRFALGGCSPFPSAPLPVRVLQSPSPTS